MVVILTLIVVIGPTTSWAAPNSRLMHDFSENGWKYHASLDPSTGVISAKTDFEWPSKASVGLTIATHKRIARDLVQQGIDIDATVIFRKPLSQEEFEQFIADTGMEVLDYVIRYVTVSDQRVTIFGTPNNSQLVASADLEVVLNDLAERDPGTVSGWIEVRGRLPATSYHLVEKKPYVYFIDVTRTAVHAVFKGQPNAENATVELIEPQVYWMLEDLGLVNTR